MQLLDNSFLICIALRLVYTPQKLFVILSNSVTTPGVLPEQHVRSLKRGAFFVRY